MTLTCSRRCSPRTKTDQASSTSTTCSSLCRTKTRSPATSSNQTLFSNNSNNIISHPLTAKTGYMEVIVLRRWANAKSSTSRLWTRGGPRRNTPSSHSHMQISSKSFWKGIMEQEHNNRYLVQVRVRMSLDGTTIWSSLTSCSWLTLVRGMSCWVSTSSCWISTWAGWSTKNTKRRRLSRRSTALWCAKISTMRVTAATAHSTLRIKTNNRKERELDSLTTLTP